MVYQEVVREKLAEVGRLLAQNREQQVGSPRSRPLAWQSCHSYPTATHRPLAPAHTQPLSPRRKSRGCWPGRKAPR